MAGITHLAWRNLGRNRRRTLITATALALGTALSVGTYGLMDGMLVSMLDTLTRYDLGHLQAHRKGYLGEPTLDRTLPGTGAIARRMRADPQVAGVAPRVLGFALASKGSRSRGVQIFGVDPRREQKVTSLQEQIKKGRYLSDEATPWPLGRALSANERREDEALTQRAKAKVTDELDALESLDDKGVEGTTGTTGT
ncbi:MAG: ABC transporter permease, partial [Deltaproteobacteria bacterium]|nr:ABC transporter permease [Deltaproteobacteria bacterium]